MFISSRSIPLSYATRAFHHRNTEQRYISYRIGLRKACIDDLFVISSFPNRETGVTDSFMIRSDGHSDS